MIKKEYRNIINGAFSFLKERCLFCEKQIKHGIFCDKICKDLFFDEQKEVNIRKYVPKKKYNRKQRIYDISGILTKEFISEMKEEVDKNIKKLIRER